jgi:hypothetical protein
MNGEFGGFGMGGTVKVLCGRSSGVTEENHKTSR